MEIGQKVQGVYLGDFSFSGVVESRRFITVKTDGCVEHIVKLNFPLVVYGRETDVIVMNTLFDGGASSYSRFTCWMKPDQA